MLKLLDQLPLWKTLRALPARVDALERRLAELEGATPAPHLTTCAQCGKPARVTAIRPHPQFSFGGVKLRTVTCEDGHAIDYDWTPGKD